MPELTYVTEDNIVNVYVDGSLRGNYDSPVDGMSCLSWSWGTSILSVFVLTSEIHKTCESFARLEDIPF